MSETYLYRHFDANGDLLYVGISLSAIDRLRQHKKSSWFSEIASVTITAYPTRDEALEQEAIAIRDEKPCRNIRGVPKRRPESAQETVEPETVSVRWTRAALRQLEEESSETNCGFTPAPLDAGVLA